MRLELRRLLSGAALVAMVALAAAAVTAAPAQADLSRAEEWNLARIGAAEAWQHGDGAGTVIGIIDTGISARHPDLAGRVDNSVTCLRGTCIEGSAVDGHGHGTAVAGVAATVAPAARLAVVKAIDDDGLGAVEDINAGIRWLVDRGVRVINLSLGDPNVTLVARLGTPMAPAIEYAWSRGAVTVLAAGNGYAGILGSGSANYGNLNAIVVGATDASGAKAWYSSPLGNAKWGLAAPGGSGTDPAGQIRSAALPGGHAGFVGTSLAAPHVSASVALLMGRGLGPREAVEHVLATSDPSAGCGDGCHGELRAGAALAALAAPGEPVQARTDEVNAVRADDGATEDRSGSASLIVVAVILVMLVTAGAGMAARRR